MVVLKFSTGEYCYIDGRLYEKIERAKAKLKKDDDLVLCIDGTERSGKSVLAQQLAKALDPSFTEERMSMTPQEFVNILDKAQPYQAIVFDEAFRGASSQNALGKINRIIKNKFMEMGQKNLIVIIVLPNVFMLEKYFVLHRARGLFHVYRNKKTGNRGYWAFFNHKRMKQLYIEGKKNMIYAGKKIPKALMLGRFYDQYVINEEIYREKKRKSFSEESDIQTHKEEGATRKYLHQRNKCLAMLKEKLGISYRELADLLRRDYELDLDENTIKDAVYSTNKDKVNLNE
jgi:hypothetical protein